MTWAQRLKCVFNIDIETCGECGGTVKVMPEALAALVGQVLKRVLAHEKEKIALVKFNSQPVSRAPWNTSSTGRRWLFCLIREWLLLAERSRR